MNLSTGLIQQYQQLTAGRTKVLIILAWNPKGVRCETEIHYNVTTTLLAARSAATDRHSSFPAKTTTFPLRMITHFVATSDGWNIHLC